MHVTCETVINKDFYYVMFFADIIMNEFFIQ